VSKEHFVNLARSRALAFGPHKAHTSAIDRDDIAVSHVLDTSAEGFKDPLHGGPRGFFADQFENLANTEAHYTSTAPEIWRQAGGRIDGFVAGAGAWRRNRAPDKPNRSDAGTGGTLAGCARYLKDRKRSIQIALADPQGSGLYNRVRRWASLRSGLECGAGQVWRHVLAGGGRGDAAQTSK
jgi:cysteine synthase A